MRVALDLVRNSPDFILEQDGSRMQDPRFLIFGKIPLWRFLFIKLIVFFYDRQKDYLRKLEDQEAGHGLLVHRRERRSRRGGA